VSVTVVDSVAPDISQNLSTILQAGGYVIPRDPRQVTTISKLGATNALGVVKIKVISESFVGQINPMHDPSGFLDIDVGGQVGEGVEVEVWTLNNCWIEEFKPSELDYSSDELATIDLKLRYDWASLETFHGAEGKPAQLLANVGLEDPFKRF
jgi:hypothetical protein